VLVDMRARLAASTRPRRIFEVTLQAASAAGLVGAKRVLDSTPLYDAVATMDTLTLIRSAIRGLLRGAEAELEVVRRAVLVSGDDYASNSKPQIDWDDASAREQLIDSRARDARACLLVLDDRKLTEAVEQAGQLLASVVGQDLEQTDCGVFRIARRVAKDRIISTVDPDARHGHKTSARGFDGYKGHVAVDPDSEIVTDTVVSAGNVGDAAVAEDLIDDLLDQQRPSSPASTGAEQTAESTVEQPDDEPDDEAVGEAVGEGDHVVGADDPAVYGDAAYGSGAFLDLLAGANIASGCKTQPPTAAGGRFAKDRFVIDLGTDTVTCPGELTVPIRRGREGDGIASFGDGCAGCPLRAQCTTAASGRTVSVGRYEQRLADARAEQQQPQWQADYRATRPKVERKLGHLMRRKHGGRRARVRGKDKVDADFNLLAAAANIARMAVLGLRSTGTGWATATA
jgi:IS5 family transposase